MKYEIEKPAITLTVFEQSEFSKEGGKAIIARDPRVPGVEGYGRNEHEAESMLRKVIEVRKLHVPDSRSVGGALPKKTPLWIQTPAPAFA